MKKFFTFFAAVAMMFAANANTLDVCMGESYASSLPIYGLWADTENTLGQMIYPADMLEDMVGGEITGVQFYTAINAYEYFDIDHDANGNGERDYINFDGATVQLSLMVVDELGFTVEEAMVGATAVATTTPVKGDRYMTFVLDEPFAYEGGNLLVECKVIVGGDWGTTYYWVEGVEDYYPGYYEYEGYSGMTGYAVDYLPAATFTYNAAVGPVNPPVEPTEKTGAPTFHGYTEDGIHGYFVEIIPTEPSVIYYRVIYPDGTESEWAEYTEILSFEGDGKYRVEAYAVAEGKLASEQIAYEFVVAPVTGIDEMMSGKTVADVRYFNMAGQEMQEANGLTIVVTTYTDGTTNTVKVVK